MMRAIDADELIKDIDYSADMGGALGKVVECVKYYAKYMVASAPTIEPEQRWIPCSERLPDTNRDVLLQFGNSMGVGFWEHNSWGINTGDDIYSEIGEREAQPIAWRELPEPWEGGT